MAKYKVLRGSHQIMVGETPKGGGVPQVSVATHRAGDIFEAPEGKNYDERIKHTQFKRLLRVPDDAPVKRSPPPEPEETVVRFVDREPKLEGPLANPFLESIRGMTVPELKELAADNGVDLAGANKRDDILKRLQSCVSS